MFRPIPQNRPAYPVCCRRHTPKEGEDGYGLLAHKSDTDQIKKQRKIQEVIKHGYQLESLKEGSTVDEEVLDSFFDLLLEDHDEVEVVPGTWGAILFTLLKTYDDITTQEVAGAWKILIVTLFASTLAAFLQIFMLRYIFKYISQPTVERLQDQYAIYHRTCFFDDGTFSEALCQQLPAELSRELCSAAIRHKLFLVTVMTIWALTMATEFESILNGFKKIMHLRSLPEGIPHSDIVVEIETGGRHSANHLRVFGITPTLRTLCLLIVIVPRVCIGVTLYVLGNHWLFATTGLADLILNSVGLQFVLQIPILVAKTVLPDKMIELLNRTKYCLKASENAAGHLTGSHRIMKKTMFALCVLLITLVYTIYGQSIIPNYNGDLEDHCSPLDKDTNWASILPIGYSKGLEFPFGNSTGG
jgi:hypothetical protein